MEAAILLLSGASGSGIEKILEDSIRAPRRHKAVDTQLPGMLVKAPRSASGFITQASLGSCSPSSLHCAPGKAPKALQPTFPRPTFLVASSPEAPEKSYAPSWKTLEPRRGGLRQRWPRLMGGLQTSSEMTWVQEMSVTVGQCCRSAHSPAPSWPAGLLKVTVCLWTDVVSFLCAHLRPPAFCRAFEQSAATVRVRLLAWLSSSPN